jgi:hypothetical protein
MDILWIRMQCFVMHTKTAFARDWKISTIQNVHMGIVPCEIKRRKVAHFRAVPILTIREFN